MPKLNELKFNNRYPKLKNYKTGMVIFLISGLTGAILKQKYDILTTLDTMRDDGKFYALDDNQAYLVVFLAGDDGGIFTTIRKDNTENRAKYEVGSTFKIIIEE
jgi:hypothetical protein